MVASQSIFIGSTKSGVMFFDSADGIHSRQASNQLQRLNLRNIMSGIEIAGLVLGAISLLISAIEHYNNGLEPIKVFWMWQGKLSETRSSLLQQYTSYTMTLQLLLKDITDNEELDNIISNPGSDLWKNLDIEERIRAKLVVAYTSYLDIIREIKGIILVLSKHLDLDRATIVYKSLNLEFRQFLIRL